jgi:hypothetical protein
MGRVFFNVRENIDKDSCTGTDTYVMTAEDSGKTFLVSGGTQAITLLPAASMVEGWNCKFITTASPTGDKTIGAGSTVIHGSTAQAGTAAVAATDSTAATNVIIEAASQAGNVLDIICDGSLYHAHGIQGQNAAFSFS